MLFKELEVGDYFCIKGNSRCFLKLRRDYLHGINAFPLVMPRYKIYIPHSIEALGYKMGDYQEVEKVSNAEIKKLLDDYFSEKESLKHSVVKRFPSKNKEEYIVCSAVWVKDDTKMFSPPVNIDRGYVAYGLRHHNCFEVISRLYGFKEGEGYPNSYKKLEKVQGFLTSKNRFVDRQEGLKIAKEMKQVSLPIGHENLYSEDLY